MSRGGAQTQSRGPHPHLLDEEMIRRASEILEIPGRFHLHQTIFRGCVRPSTHPTGTSCHQESSAAPSSRWRPSLGPLTALGATTFLFCISLPELEDFFIPLLFSLGALFPFLFDFIRNGFSRFFLCSDFYIRWQYTNVGDTGTWSCLREYWALSLCQMLKPFIYYLTLEMYARRRVSETDESPSEEISAKSFFSKWETF